MGYGYKGEMEYLMSSLHGTANEVPITNKNNVNSEQSVIVDTIKDLLLLDYRGPITVRKYHNDLNYEPKTYIFNETLNKLYHNGGNIIDPLKEFPIDWNLNEDWFTQKNSGLGVWICYESEQLDAKWFGVRGDGISDDFRPLQSAIHSLSGWNGNSYNIDYKNPKKLYISEGTYRITDSLTVTQMNSIVGAGYSAGDSKGTEILCDFADFTSPTNNYSNLAEGHSDIALDKKPMIYNVKMFNYSSISGIRLNGNNKDVYGLYLNEMYYSKLDTIVIHSCLNSGLSIMNSQFNEVRNISYVGNAGPLRIINSCTLDFDNLDIENTQSMGTDLEIVHYNPWKGGINIRNIHIEELPGGSKIAPGPVWLIGQKGVKIEGLFGLFSTDTDSGSLERYIYYMDPQDYYFDGNTISSSPIYSCEMESVGSGHMFIKMDPEVRNTKILGMKVVQDEISNNEHQTSYTNFQTGLKVLNKEGYKTMWFDEDEIHFFDNSNRRILPENADMILEDTHGRLKLKAGTLAGSSELQSHANLLTILNKDGNHGTFEDGLIRLSGYYIWVDSTGKMRMKNSTPTSDTDGTLVGA